MSTKSSRQKGSHYKKNVANIPRHMKSHIKIQVRQFQCKLCPSRYNHNSSLQRHLKTHNLEKGFKCDLCPKAFYNNNYLSTHRKGVHDKQKDFDCLFCNQTFLERSNQREHLLRHIEEKPYTCKLCDKSFCFVGNRNKHLRSHTGEKIHKCRICNKSFVTKSNLQRHQKSHTRNCSLCDATFLDESSLKLHLHENHDVKIFQCLKCPRAFNHSSNLREHENIIHRDAKPEHWCVFCSKGFYSKPRLFAHLFCHTLERSAMCKFCDATYASTSELNRHMRRNHARCNWIKS